MNARTLLLIASPILALVACGSTDPNPPSSGLSGLSGGGGGSGGGGVDGGGVGQDGSGSPPCERDTDCKDEERCAFPIAKVCASYGQCFPKGPYCNLEDLGCACDGTTVGIECAAGMPTGYAPKPLANRSACRADAGLSWTGGGMGNANGKCSSDLGFFEAAVVACKGQGYLTTWKPDEKCGLGSSSSATYTCCPQAPAGCVSGSGANGQGVCSSNEAFFAGAEASCANLKLDVTAFSTDDRCGPDSSNRFSYTCCP
jgi:hypothetical protein